MTRLCLALCLTLLACRLTKVPQEQDELLHYLWQSYDADDATLVAAVNSVHTVLGAAKLKNGGDTSGGISDLSTSEIAELTFDVQPDPAKARGFFFFRRVACSLAQVERAFYAQNQNELYPGVYDTYERTFTDSVDQYATGERNQLGWNTGLDATILGTRYHEDIIGHMRRVITPAHDPAPAGSFFIGRAYLPRPAQFMSKDSFNQDFQLELFYPLDDTSVMHLFASWREMDIGGFSIESDLTVSITLGNLVGFDDKTADLCKNGKV